MIEFVGRSRGVIDEAGRFGAYFDAQHQAAQRRWQDAEGRRRYDEANRFARDEALRAQAERDPAMFQSYDETFAGLQPRGATLQPPANTQAGMAPPGGGAGTTTRPDLSRLPWPASRARPAASATNNVEVPVVDAPVQPRLFTREDFANDPQLSARLQAAQDRGEVVIQIQRDMAGGLTGLLVTPRTNRIPLTAQGAPDPGIGPLRARRDPNNIFGFSELYIQGQGQERVDAADMGDFPVGPTLTGEGFNDRQTGGAPTAGGLPRSDQIDWTATGIPGFRLTQAIRPEGERPRGGAANSPHYLSQGGTAVDFNIGEPGNVLVPTPQQEAQVRQRIAEHVGVPVSQLRGGFTNEGTAPHFHYSWGEGGADTGTGTTQAGGLGLDGGNDLFGAEYDPTQDDYFEGLRDGSRPMVATPEMQMAMALVRDSMSRSQLASRHGQNAIADQAFAGAVQGYAQYVGAARTALFRAASGGNMEAAARLVEDTNGYPRGTVRFARTPEDRNRWMLQTQSENGEWINTNEVPHHRQQWLESLNGLVDAASAAQNREASAEMQRAVMENRRHIRVAQGQEAIAILRMQSEQAIALLNERGRQAISRGRVQTAVDSETGAVWVIHPDVDEYGNQYFRYVQLSNGDVPTPNVDDNPNETVNMPIVRDVTTQGAMTGITGVRAN